MANVLESLVARGRRVKNIKEQREITFCLADLSTKTEIHERLVKKGGIITLVDILSSSKDAEVQQFAAIAVANTSSSTSQCNEIVKLEGVTTCLIKYVGDERADSIVKQYCAMALGNLLVEPATHEILVQQGVSVALVTMLKNCTEGRELESGKHAAFAISNLSSSRINHQQTVEHGAIELLIALACCEDLDTQRQALSALRGLCLTPINRITVVQKGILDPLILVSRSDDVDIVREAACSLSCLSSCEENKEEMSYRAMSTLISLMLHGDNEIERHACGAIGNLMEDTAFHPRFVEERGVTPLVALCNSSCPPCCLEATRSVSNLSSNTDLIEFLIGENVLPPLISSIRNDEDNARFSALAIANFTSNSPSLFRLVQGGVIPPLVSLVASARHLECRRYGAMALANITACECFHANAMEAGAPGALFALSNTGDTVSQHYVGCVLANLSSNVANHEPVIEMGGLQPIITLAYDRSPSVHKQAAAALRGFSATGNIKMKIVHEGGLEPLSHLLLSNDVDVLRETTACLCNLSLGDENKFEVVKSGAVAPLVTHMSSEDAEIACLACECLANLAEMSDNQDIIVHIGAIVPCISAMRSRHITVQRESGRLLANLSASYNKLAADTIVDSNGHLVLASYLLSQDVACQRVGSFGIGNLCTHDHHRLTLMKVGVLESLTSLTRSEKIEPEIRRFAMLAIANLAASINTHEQFVMQGTIPMLISFSNSDDADMRNFAAHAVAQLARNYDMMEIITSEGGLWPVLYLARSDNRRVQRDVLPALAKLSFLECNKIPICVNGSLPPIIDSINYNPKESQLACCALANLVEDAGNMQSSVDHGCIPLLIQALSTDSESAQRESARAIGNLAVNIDYCDEIISRDSIERLVHCFRGQSCECKRMVAFALSNISSNIKSHDKLLTHNILNLVQNECLASIDPKRFSDHETVRFCLSIISNLTGCMKNHSTMASFIDILIDFTRHRDVKCRQYSILALGNLCSHPDNVKRLTTTNCIDALVAFSFPPVMDDSVNSQFQAIAGLRGMSKCAPLRLAILRAGALESLTLCARGNNKFPDGEVQREAILTLTNLALEPGNRLVIAKSGALPALVTIVKSSDTGCIAHAVMALATLAETSIEIHDLILIEKCIIPMFELVRGEHVHIDIKRSISRCIALFASNPDTHDQLLQPEVTKLILMIFVESRDIICKRYGALTMANLALVEKNHGVLSEAELIASIISLARSQDVETLRSVAFALSSLSNNRACHSVLEEAGAVGSLVILLGCGDSETGLQSCVTVKNLSKCHKFRNLFVNSQGLDPLLALSTTDDLETKRELVAALKNISLSHENKVAVMQNGMDLIANLCRDSDNEVSHQSCGVIANISEIQANKIQMIERGIILHLHAAMLPDSPPDSEGKPNSQSRIVSQPLQGLVLRESVRALANLSSAIQNTAHIVGSGSLCHLKCAFHSSDILSRRFAAMALSNLAINLECHARIIHEVKVSSLMSLANQELRNFIDIQTQQHAMACLANLASCNATHDELIRAGCAELVIDHVNSYDLDLRTNALLCFANLASTPANHLVLSKFCRVHVLIENLECHCRIVQFRALMSIRGLSANISMRKQIITAGGIEVLLSLVHTEDIPFKLEITSTLCNLSLGGCMGDRAHEVLKKIDLSSLVSYLCSADSTQRIFGAIAIGNIASHLHMQAPVFESGALQALIGVSSTNARINDESQRCIAYAVCNLSAELVNRMSIITKGGLRSIMYLCQTGDDADMLAALSTLRGISASADSRRSIVQEGALSIVALAMKSGNLKCRREGSSLFVHLSLNDDNKFDIAWSNEIEDTFSGLLLENDVACISQTCRAVANICELTELHLRISQVFTVEQLEVLSSQRVDSEVAMESLRCIANLSSNFSMHKEIVRPKLLKNLIAFCSHTLLDVRRLSVLALANFCVNVDIHMKFDTNVLLSVFQDIISCETSSVVDHQCVLVDAKRYACMGIGALCRYASAASQLIRFGTVPSLIKLLSNGPEMSVHVAFVFKKLSMNHSAHQELSLNRVSSALLERAQTLNGHFTKYCVASLRSLNDHEAIRSEMIANTDLFEFLSDCCNVEDVESSREIASFVCHLTICDTTKVAISSRLLDHMFTLCHSSDAETSRFALGSLANVAEDLKTHEMIVKRDRLLQIMNRLRLDHCTSIVRESSRLIANLLSSTTLHEQFLNEDGMEAISRVRGLYDYECILNYAVALKKLSVNSSTHSAFFCRNGITAVIDLTGHHDTNIKLQSSATLRDISSNPNFHSAFVEVGGMRTAIDLVSDSHIGINTIGLGILRHLSISLSLKSLVLESGVINIIEGCIATIKDSDLLYQSAALLANIAECGKNKAPLVRMGTLRCLVLLGECPQAEVKVQTARAYALLSSAPENVAAFDEHILLSLLKLLQCGEEECGRDCASAIQNIASNDEQKALIGQCDGIFPLVRLLNSPYASCHEKSCQALCRLTLIEENKIAAFRHGGIKPLLELCNMKARNGTYEALLVLVNLSTCADYQHKLVDEGGIRVLKPLASSDDPRLRQYSIMIICNLTSNDMTRDHIARQFDLRLLIELMDDKLLECKTFATMTICNLASSLTHGAAVVMAGGVARLAEITSNSGGIEIQRAALLAMYNLSTCEASHTLLAMENVMHTIISSCRNSDVFCRRFAFLILSNVACNDKTRINATKGGGLQAAILALRDADSSIVTFACICLTNMANESNTQSQIVVHGGLPFLVTLSLNNYDETGDCVRMCLSNLAANETNHLPLEGAFEILVDSAASEDSRSIYHRFGIANLTSNAEILSQIGRRGGIRPLLALSKSPDPHIQNLSLCALRRLALIRENRDRLVAEEIVQTLVNLSFNTKDTEIQREIAACFSNLTLNTNHRLDITRTAISELSKLSRSEDVDTVTLSLGSIGNLAEDINTHIYIVQSNSVSWMCVCLDHAETDIKREAIRAIANILSTRELHQEVIKHGLDNIIRLSSSSCEECQYLAALSFRKLSPSPSSHHMLITNGLQNLLGLTKVLDKMTRKHAATAIRDISASEHDKTIFFKVGTIAAMIELMRDHEKDVQIIAVATLRHLSPHPSIKEDFSRSGLVKSVVRCIAWANEDMKCQIAGLFANLSEQKECQSAMIIQGVIPALDKLACSAHVEIRQDCGRALANLCANEEKQYTIYRLGGLKTLVDLSNVICEVCQRYVAISMRFMASSLEVQRSIAKENELAPYLQFSSSELLDLKRSAASSLASMSLNQAGRSMVLKKGGIKAVLQLCVHLDSIVQRNAVFCIANFAGSPERQYVGKEGGVETLKAVVTMSNDAMILCDAARALSSLSTHVPTKAIMISLEISQTFNKLSKSSDNSTQRFAALGLCNLCLGTSEQKESIVNQGALRILIFLLRFPDLEMERCASLAVAALSLGSDKNKLGIIGSGFIRPLIEMISYPDAGMRQCALLALNSASLGEASNAKEMFFRENGLSPLLTLMATEDDESIHSGIFLLGTLAENIEIRDAIVASDCVQLMVKKSSAGSIEIKRAVAYVFSLLSECPDYLDSIRENGGLETIVTLASLVDDECQDYGAFSLAFLSNNKSLQVPLVRLGGVRPLVSMMANNSESKNFAALALLKLADNFENHITIAEEGGIQALLALGRSKVSSENVQYKAQISVGQMAKHAASQLISKDKSLL